MASNQIPIPLIVRTGKDRRTNRYDTPLTVAGSLHRNGVARYSKTKRLTVERGVQGGIVFRVVVSAWMPIFEKSTEMAIKRVFKSGWLP